jgi:tRNA(Ile)-lysidine synthase TilS/MesJ
MILDGEKLQLLSSENDKDGIKIIYPLINVPRQWIQSWVESENFNCTFPECDGLPREMLKFLEVFIPDVREKLYRSGVYLSNENDF